MAAILLLPVASAASFPLYGEWDWGWNASSVFFVLALLSIVVMLIAPVRAFIGGAPIIGPVLSMGIVGIVLFAGVGAAFTPGSIFSSSTTASPTASVSQFDSLSFEPTSDVTFYAADFASPSTTLDPAASVFPSTSSVSDKDALEGTELPTYSVTLSSGSGTRNGIQVQTYGCAFDVMYDLANYYQDIARDVDLCHKSNENGNNDVSLETQHLQKIGTLNLATSSSTLTCTAGNQCTYSLVLKNSASASYIRAPAVKWANNDTDSHTLDSVITGSDCQIVEEASVQYIVFTGAQATIGPSGLVSCGLKITRASGDADATGFTLVADDLWKKYEASTWNKNSNIRGAAATSVYDVTFA